MSILREAVRAILAEIDMTKLAARAARQKGRGIVIDMSGRDMRLMVIEPSDDPKGLPRVVASTNAYALEIERSEYVIPKQNSRWRLNTFFGNDSGAAILALYCTIAKCGRVVPDHSVSPAAQGVIKRYWEQNANDTSLVEPEADPDRNDDVKDEPDPDYLRAAYLRPPGSADVLVPLLETGKRMVEEFVKRNPQIPQDYDGAVAKLRYSAERGFDAAYSDESRTQGKPSEDVEVAQWERLKDQAAHTVPNGWSPLLQQRVATAMALPTARNLQHLGISIASLRISASPTVWARFRSKNDEFIEKMSTKFSAEDWDEFLERAFRAE